MATSDTLHSVLLQLFTRAETIIAAYPVWGVSFFIVFAALSAMLAFVSSALLVPVAINAWGEPLSMFFLWFGWILGGACSYGIGRFLGRPVVAYFLSNATLDQYGDRVSTHAPFGLVVLFQLALPSEVPGYLLGLVRYKFVKFLAALGLAELPYAVVTVYLGASFLEQRILVLISVGIAVALFGICAFLVLRKRLSL